MGSFLQVPVGLHARGYPVLAMRVDDYGRVSITVDGQNWEIPQATAVTVGVDTTMSVEFGDVHVASSPASAVPSTVRVQLVDSKLDVNAHLDEVKLKPPGYSDEFKVTVNQTGSWSINTY